MRLIALKEPLADDRYPDELKVRAGQIGMVTGIRRLGDVIHYWVKFYQHVEEQSLTFDEFDVVSDV